MIRLHNTQLLFALDRNPQPESAPFPPLGTAVEKRTFAQVSAYEQVTTENFRLDFFLTCGPLGNTIQLQGFDGCDSVETDSPIEHHPGRTGEEMLTLPGEHFYFIESIELIQPNEDAVRALGGLAVSASQCPGLQTRSRYPGGPDFAREWHSSWSRGRPRGPASPARASKKPDRPRRERLPSS